jgi:hypothetical protein
MARVKSEAIKEIIETGMKSRDAYESVMKS